MELDQHLLLHDLADATGNTVAGLDSVLSVLTDWGIINPDLAALYIKELEA